MYKINVYKIITVLILLIVISYLVKTEFLNRHKTSSKTKNPLGLAFTNYSIVLIYARTLSYFSKAGLKRHEWETPTEYSKRLMDSFPAESQIASDFDAITALFVMFRYGRDTASSSDVATCDKLSDNLKALIKAHGKIGSQNASGA